MYNGTAIAIRSPCSMILGWNGGALRDGLSGTLSDAILAIPYAEPEKAGIVIKINRIPKNRTNAYFFISKIFLQIEDLSFVTYSYEL